MGNQNDVLGNYDPYELNIGREKKKGIPIKQMIHTNEANWSTRSATCFVEQGHC